MYLAFCLSHQQGTTINVIPLFLASSRFKLSLNCCCSSVVWENALSLRKWWRSYEGREIVRFVVLGNNTQPETRRRDWALVDTHRVLNDALSEDSSSPPRSWRWSTSLPPIIRPSVVFFWKNWLNALPETGKIQLVRDDVVVRISLSWWTSSPIVV